LPKSYRNGLILSPFFETKRIRKMKISKLIITPIVSGGKNIYIHNPETVRAERLINDRLSSSSGYYVEERVPRRLPKWLKNLGINIKTMVK